MIYKISNSITNAIKQSLTRPEMGGILGIDANRVVTKFYHDSTGTTTTAHYIPDVEKLNEVILRWSTEGIAFIGFVHTHPKGKNKLSTCDVDYAKKIKVECSLLEILMLLYIPEDNKFLQYVL